MKIPGAKPVPIKGPKRQLVTAVAALADPAVDDTRMAAILESTVDSLKVTRTRLPAEVKERLGAGTQRWALSGTRVDVIALRDELRELQRAGVDAERDRIRSALRSATQPLLPDIKPGGKYESPWLVKERAALNDLRADLTVLAIAWAEERSDPWADDLRAKLSEIKPTREAPARATVRRASWSSPSTEVSNIGFADAAQLFGREHELKLVRSRFDDGAAWQVIWGEGGIGKSDLALTFAARHAGDYRVRWKVNSETDVELRSGLRRLAKRLGIASVDNSSVIAKEDTDATQYLADLGDYLQSGFADPWLLILDNVERPDALAEALRYLPANGHLLVTSQWPDWLGTRARDLQLWGLGIDDATSLMAEVSGRLVDEDLQAICLALECNPMLLRHAAMTMRSDGIGAGEYLDRLRRGIEEAVRLWPELDLTRRHAITTYGLAIDKATVRADGHPGAKPLMEIVAFLAPEPVTEPLLHSMVGMDRVPALDDENALTQARRALRSRSLIQTYQRTESFSVHRVMQAVVRLGLDGEQSLDRLRTAVETVGRCLPDLWSPDHSNQVAPLAPHIDVLLAHVERRGDAALRTRAAPLASHLGLFRRSQSEWSAAEAAHQRAVDLSRDDEDRRAAAGRGVLLANVMRQRGRFASAEVAMGSALPSLRAAAGSDDPDLSYALTVQARILRTRPDSRPLDARRYLDEALEILDRQADADPDQLSRTLNYSAVLLRQLGDFDAAEAQSRRGFRILVGQEPEEWLSRGLEGQVNPLLATHLRALGNLWRVLGRFREARDTHERALEIVAEIYGDDHTDVGRCLDSLGRVQREYGDFSGALRSFTRAREISDYRFGDRYPHAATALTNAALTLREMDRLDEALFAADEAVSIYRDNYGDTWEEGIGSLRNEHTAWAVFVLADLRARAGDHVAAERDHREVLRLRNEKYRRRDHPHIGSSLYALGDIAAMTGRPDQALDLHASAREIRISAFGEGRGSYWVAQSDARLGDLLDGDEALAHLSSAERVWRRQLAPGHPWLVRIRQRLSERLGRSQLETPMT